MWSGFSRGDNDLLFVEHNVFVSSRSYVRNLEIYVFTVWSKLYFYTSM